MAMRLALPKDINGNKPFAVNDSCIGSGSMILATAKAIKDMGINYRKCMEVTVQDLDWKSVYMSYVQFSLAGIKATVVQGDTLNDPYKEGYPEERVFRTPDRMGLPIDILDY